MKLNKKQAEEEIKNFFEDIKNKTPAQIRKLKRLAMHHKIRLGEKRKLFCKYCYSPRLKVVRITGKIKTIKCESCDKLMRWKIK